MKVEHTRARRVPVGVPAGAQANKNEGPHMRAIVCTKYGPPNVLRLSEVDKPAPRDNEVLVKIYATTVTSSDCIVRGFKLPLSMWIPARIALGLRGPRKPILGVELAGEVEAIGKGVKRFRIGDRVFAFTGRGGFGAYAEYTCLPQDGLVAAIPAGVTYEEVAATTFACLAWHFLRKGNVRKGHKVLVYGASGAAGTYAVQLAKYMGAEVTGVSSGANLELVRSLGADKAIDYTKADFTKNGELYDVIFDAVGKTSKSNCKNALAPNGTYVSINQGNPWPRVEDLVLLMGLVKTKQIRSVIDRRYSLEQIPEAHRYVEEGHKKGNVVVTVS
jgi:NADPH:quinone reductase-like Zn-dependent oxidoreductase